MNDSATWLKQISTCAERAIVSARNIGNTEFDTSEQADTIEQEEQWESEFCVFFHPNSAKSVPDSIQLIDSIFVNSENYISILYPVELVFIAHRISFSGFFCLLFCLNFIHFQKKKKKVSINRLNHDHSVRQRNKNCYSKMLYWNAAIIRRSLRSDCMIFFISFFLYSFFF